MRAKLIMTMTVALVLGAAAPVQIAQGTAGFGVADACAQTDRLVIDDGGEGYASCAPKDGWDCIHGSIVRYNKCDPNDKGCV